MATIHQATTEKDAADLAILAEEIWRDHYTPMLGEKQVSYMLETIQSKEAIYQAMQSGMSYWLVESDGEPAGYFAHEERDGALFLSKFYLKQAFRGRGLGRFMFEEVKKAAYDHHLPSITLTVNRENTATIDTYRALGFHVLKEHVGDIGQGYVMDDYVMQYVLP